MMRPQIETSKESILEGRQGSYRHKRDIAFILSDNLIDEKSWSLARAMHFKWFLASTNERNLKFACPIISLFLWIRWAGSLPRRAPRRRRWSWSPRWWAPPGPSCRPASLFPGTEAPHRCSSHPGPRTFSSARARPLPGARSPWRALAQALLRLRVWGRVQRLRLRRILMTQPKHLSLATLWLPTSAYPSIIICPGQIIAQQPQEPGAASENAAMLQQLVDLRASNIQALSRK